ncbi:MAG: hypothetical protein ACFFB0_15660 [Promethearchaeota archaeon]
MEEIIPLLKDMLKEAIKINFDESNLTITLHIKSKVRGNLATPEEILVMLKMFGGMKEKIPMDISINSEIQTINLKLQNSNDFTKLKEIMDTIWDDAVNMLKSVMEGDFTPIKDIPNIDD